MNPLLYAKLGAAVALIAALFGAGYHFGGLASKTALEAQHAAQLQAVVNRLDENARQAAADHDRLQGVIDVYDAQKDIPNPVDIGLARRVYIAAAGGCPVPETRTVASGTQTPTALPSGDPSIVGRLQDLIEACRADAAQLSAVIQLAP